MAAAQQPSPPWRDLPADLLGLVLLHLPSLPDRVRLRAVCRSWRAGAARGRHPRLPPPLPWLALRDGSLVDLDGEPIRCPTPIPRHGIASYLSVENLAFLIHHDGGCSLLNPLSSSSSPAAITPLPGLNSAALNAAIGMPEIFIGAYLHKAYSKSVLSSPLDSSPDPLVAVVTTDERHVAVSPCKRRGVVTIVSSPEPGMTQIPGQNPTRFSDIAFFGGKLYTLTNAEGLHVLDLGSNGVDNPPNVSSRFRRCITDDPDQHEYYIDGTTKHKSLVLRYLVDSNGRLLMVRRWMNCRQQFYAGDMDKTRGFEVFAADLTDVHGRWMKVDSLGGQAIFLSSECSKSVTASQCADGIQQDCIYFMHRIYDNPSEEYHGPCVDPLADSGVYNMRDGRITLLRPRAVMSELRWKRQYLTWFFPSDE
uniref:F-box domain-containing protein n=1 Tax=Oryza punctata TaxID=4537 RepID=A0A0E0MP40_ORYPU